MDAFCKCADFYTIFFSSRKDDGGDGGDGIEAGEDHQSCGVAANDLWLVHFVLCFSSIRQNRGPGCK